MGFLVSLGTILLVPIAGMVGFVSFLNLYTAIAYALALGLFALLAERFYRKHHRSEAYDDRLTDERMREARDYILGRWKSETLED